MSVTGADSRQISSPELLPQPASLSHILLLVFLVFLAFLGGLKHLRDCLRHFLILFGHLSFIAVWRRRRSPQIQDNIQFYDITSFFLLQQLWKQTPACSAPHAHVRLRNQEPSSQITRFTLD